MSLDWPTLALYDEYAVRSERDLARNVSIDQLVTPVVNLNTVLLEPLNYTSATLSNLVEIFKWGASRVLIDLYWNSVEGVWQICPFYRDTKAPARGDDSDSDSSYPDDDDGSSMVSYRYRGKAYECNTTLTFAHFLRDIVHAQYIEKTDDNLNARLMLFTLNLKKALSAKVIPTHSDNESGLQTKAVVRDALASSSIIRHSETAAEAPSATASYEPIPSEFELDTYHLGFQINSLLNQYVYTPPLLRSDRLKTYLTWDDSGASSKGWPLMENIVFHELYRVMFSFGEIEVPESEYNTSLDESHIFTSSYIPYAGSGVLQYSSEFTAAELESTASPVCSINSKDNIVLSSNDVLNPSWLLAYDSSENRFTPSAMHKYMKCGFSPVLNATVNDGSNSTEILDYLSMGLKNGRWSWQAGQPTEEDLSASTTSAVVSGEIRRCASLTREGWVVQDCNSKFRVACRVSKGSYYWKLSSKKVTYYNTVDACTGDSMFSLPRTALQNSVLQTIRETAVGSEAIWIDMNSIAQPNCWISGGPGADCPYSTSDRQSIEVVVPTVAAVIVAVLLALTLCSRLLGHKQVQARRKRRRLMKKFGEMEYDGVPS